MQIFKAGVPYFALVFAVGFLLGTIRTLWIVPLVGARTAELMESPIMLVMTILAARWIIRHFSLPARLLPQLALGLLALALMLTAEFAFVMRIRGLSIREYITGRDPVSGTVYVVLLALVASCPFSLRDDHPRKAFTRLGTASWV